ncbi:MAG: ATP-binding protein [Dehalococcoidia bacterium]|nr:ATP-binding protein [Dehalococcoidia bacterium]
MNDNDKLDMKLGTVISGSLTQGVQVKLDPSRSVEDVAVGRYVAITGKKKRFFGMITDVSLEAVDPRAMVMPPDISDPFIARVVSGTTTYGKISVLPMLTISGGVIGGVEGPQPAKTVPSHFAGVELASQQDVELVFGCEDLKRFFIGTPLDMETKVCINMQELVKRSNGVFGKSGTGKTFLTRLLLIGMMQKSETVSLIFDMHNEYGWEGTSEKDHKVKGLKQLFPGQVAVFSLDEIYDKRRKVKSDFVVKVGYDEIEPEDIQLLRHVLNLTELSVQAVYELAKTFGDNRWLESALDLFDSGDKKFAADHNIAEGTWRNLQRGLRIMERFKFMVPHVQEDTVNKILDYIGNGKSVVLQFGGYDDIAAYVLVANLLTRRIYNQYREKVDTAVSADTKKPDQLVITIEEAHRFLNPEISSQTIFGKIAREMRKYNVTMLVIDQRPSGIDDEVMSQLGTKITCLLDNEKDVDSVLTGVAGKSELKSVLSKLESKQQALIFGHALPMPVVVKIREYGSPESYKNLGPLSAGSGGGGDTNTDALDDLWN